MAVCLFCPGLVEQVGAPAEGQCQHEVIPVVPLWQSQERALFCSVQLFSQPTNDNSNKEGEGVRLLAPVMWKKGNALERVYRYSKLMDGFNLPILNMFGGQENDKLGNYAWESFSLYSACVIAVMACLHLCT